MGFVHEQFLDKTLEGDNKGNIQATRRFHVNTDTPMTEMEVLLATDSGPGGVNIPQLYEVHPVYRFVYVSNRSAQMFTDAYNWQVTVQYSTNERNNDETDNPINERPVIRFGWQAYQVVARKAYGMRREGVGSFIKSPVYPLIADPLVGDINNLVRGTKTAPIMNSYGDKFDPPPMDDKKNLVIYISKNQSLGAQHISSLRSFQDTINEDKITIAGVVIPVYAGKLRSIDMSRKFDSLRNEYWTVDYEIEVDLELHTLKLLDDGFYYGSDPISNIEIYGTTRTKFTDKAGNDFVVPGKLDGKGFKLANNAQPVYLEYLTLFPTKWASLHLPTYV